MCHQGPQLILGGTDLAIRQLQKKPKRFQEVDEGLTGRKDDGEVVSFVFFWVVATHIFLAFSPRKLGKMNPFLTHICQRG